MNDLKKLWYELAARYADEDALIYTLWLEIDSNYSAATRYYHNLTHVQYMADKAIDYKDKLRSFDAILFSIFYHDIIYDAQRKDNEQKSAEIAVRRLSELGTPHEIVMDCRRQILATQDHGDNDDSDINYLLDFDLAILGESPQVYKHYAQNIRKEYSIYPNEVYREGRKNVLIRFLDLKCIFKTNEFQDRYGQQARANLTTELQDLQV